VGDKWTLLIVRDLAGGPRRFVELQRVLPGISTEQLRSRLNRMVADGLLTRKRYREVPPRVDYELTERASELMPVLGALARWGYDWSWSTPRQGENVTVGAIMRLAPGLLHPAKGVTGKVELTVKGDPVCAYTLTAHAGRVTLVERAAPDADARVTGSENAWIKAFAPAGSNAGLRFTGDRGLAETLLEGLVAGPERAESAVPVEGVAAARVA